ncbi:MAG: helix-turn-helix transcriptional regulator [Geothrix sp.]|nr:helix-turn-helix transcriptional regulator [Geothrix sp.]
MPNIASALKEEIIRLARKELRSETERLKKASSQYRSDIAALKRRVEALERQVSHFEKKAKSGPQPGEVSGEAAPVRFSAKGLASHRQRLGLAAAEMGLLLDVSAQTIYNWETGKSRPRQQQLAAIAALRGLGKRQVKARLAELAG